MSPRNLTPQRPQEFKPLLKVIASSEAQSGRAETMRRPAATTIVARFRNDDDHKVLRGVVSKLRGSVEFSGGGGHISGRQIAHFELGQHPVALSNAQIFLEEGDTVRVIGRYRNGLFEASSYENITKSIYRPPQGWQLWFSVGLLLVPALGFGLILIFAAIEERLIEKQFSRRWNDVLT